MKTKYSRGSVGGVVLIIIGIVLCLLLLGVLVKTYKNSSFTTGFVPTSTTSSNTSPKPGTSSAGATVTANDFVPATAACEMVIDEPDEEDNVSSSIYFSGYLTGCGSVSAQMLIGSVTVYRYASSEALAPSLTIKAARSVRSGNVNFSGYIEVPKDLRVEKGVMKFKHFLPSGGTKIINRIVYF